MVYIEPRSEQFEQKPQEKAVHKEVISVTAEAQDQAPVEQKADLKEATIVISTNFLEGFQRLIKKIRDQGFHLATFGMPLQKRATHYCKLCWNYMAKNEVDKAKKSYDQLIHVYEALDDGPTKTELYQEVHDIYSRLAEVKN